MQNMLALTEPYALPVLILAGTAVAGLFIHALLFVAVARIGKHSATIGYFNRRCRASARWLIVAIMIRAALVAGMIPALIHEFLAQTVLIAASAWFLGGLTFVAEDVILGHFDIDNADNLRARGIYTQTRFLKRAVIAVIIIVALGMTLMTFETVRSLGTGILASAGIVGIVVGLAAQKSLGTLLAGLQIVFTQPIRLDDVVIVENEWGKIEDITLTYVVVRIWDERRLIMPITHFIEKPFQNWTRVSSQIMGTVFLYTDYAIPVEDLRAELTRILEDSPLWDRRANSLVVTNAKEHTLEVRALMSAADASKLWDLRCLVRERLVDYVRRAHPGCLPRFRADLTQDMNGSET